MLPQIDNLVNTSLLLSNKEYIPCFSVLYVHLPCIHVAHIIHVSMFTCITYTGNKEYHYYSLLMHPDLAMSSAPSGLPKEPPKDCSQVDYSSMQHQ